MTTDNGALPATLGEFLTLDGLAKSLNVSKSTVYGWRRDLGLPAIQLGKRTFVHEPAVARWLKGRETVRTASE
jgi:excisionase family DNA binding protein